MRKICFSLVVLSMILLMVGLSFAQTPRQPTSSEGKTTFVNIAVTGLDVDGTDSILAPGTPSYIEMTSCKGTVFYLYISYDEVLCMASELSVGYLASPTTTHWGGQTASGVVVGTQS